MSLLVPFSKILRSVSGHGMGGGISVSADGTLFASADYSFHAVYIYGMDAKGERTGPPVVVGTVGVRGVSGLLLNYPEYLCFVRRGSVDTLLISNGCGGRVVEVTTSGTYLRDIPTPGNNWNQPYFLSFCEKTDLIAMASWAGENPVLCVHYESGAVALTLCESTKRAAMAVLTPDGEYILVPDGPTGEISKYSVSTGEVVACVVSKGDGLPWARKVLIDDEGNILVTNTSGVWILSPSGMKSRHMFSPDGVYSMTYSTLLNGLIIKDAISGDVSVIPYARNWRDSSTCAWISACTL